MFAFTLSPGHILVLLAIGVFLFGKRLPEVGHWVGKGLKEFQNGMRGIEHEVTETLTRSDAASPARPPQRINAVPSDTNGPLPV